MELTGRIESSNAAEWNEKSTGALPATGDLILECAELSYISSAGIRVIINAYKEMKKHGGTVILKDVAPPVMEVLELTGVSDFVTIS